MGHPHPVPLPDPQTYDMLVFCHLRWDFVYQRPQHLIDRMSKHYRILFIEEPIPGDTGHQHASTLREINKNLSVLRPAYPTIDGMEEILSKYVANKNVAVGWFYSAAFVSLIQHFNFRKIVYDCMDELTLFKGASPQLAAQEKYLLSEANIVFTGGKLLYEAKIKEHNNVHCFPSSVDRTHFEKALNGIAIPCEMKLTHPVVGYFGVIDERINLPLLQNTADRMPKTSFVMVGPLAKITEEDLPRAANIHYTGMKPYDKLPNYLKAFDIAMMPFALNDATKYISPTKTLEYMAGQKPIISTAVYDVVRDYSRCVEIVSDENEFCQAIDKVLHTNHKEKEKRKKQYDNILKATSWDQTAEKMYEIIKAA
jgi:glycosyltransferase involved in cell wall biosynthesis